MPSKKESTLDTKSSLVDADKVRIINSADNDDSEAMSYADLKTQLSTDIAPSSGASSHDPAGSYTILDDDGYTHIIDSATGTITLPTLADNYNRIITIVRDVADSSTPLIIDAAESTNIAGSLYQYIYGRYGNIKLMASEDAGEWVFVGTPFDPYVIQFESNADTPISTPSSGTWYNLTSHSIVALPGDWVPRYSGMFFNRVTAAVELQLKITLSTSSSSESEKDYTTNVRQGPLTSLGASVFMNGISTGSPVISVLSNTTYYLLVLGLWSGTNNYLGTLSNSMPCTITLERSF